MSSAERPSGPHLGMPVRSAGVPLEQARAAVILLHGRGASAHSILSLADHFRQPHAAYLAPEAAGNSWYPYSFLAPIQNNEPYLSSALAAVEELLATLIRSGTPPARTLILGFSQGACLACEFVARHAQRYGGLAGLSGGLIGPPETPREYPGSLDGTPVFLGCSDIDPHIPLDRVHETAQTLRQLRGEVTENIYPGMGHTINDDEIRHVAQMLQALSSV
jgi:predicted esterase